MDPGFQNTIQNTFEAANFIRDVGYKLVTLKEGYCETTLEVAEKHLQQDNFIHAGVVATMADHTAGTAGASVIPEGFIVLTAEYKINLLRPASGTSLFCKAMVLKPGKVLVVVESEVYARNNTEEKMIAKAIVTLAVVKKISG